MDINTATICGRLTRDPQVKCFSDDKFVANFSLAVNGYKKGDNQEVSFIDCTAWGKLAELLGRSVVKGGRLVVTGSLKQDNWEDKEGNKRSKLGINVKDCQILDWANDGKDQPAGHTPPSAAPVADIEDEPPFSSPL